MLLDTTQKCSVSVKLSPTVVNSMQSLSGDILIDPRSL